MLLCASLVTKRSFILLAAYSPEWALFSMHVQSAFWAWCLSDCSGHHMKLCYLCTLGCFSHQVKLLHALLFFSHQVEFCFMWRSKCFRHQMKLSIRLAVYSASCLVTRLSFALGVPLLALISSFSFVLACCFGHRVKLYYLCTCVYFSYKVELLCTWLL